MQNKSPIKRKISIYLDLKGITPYRFYKETGVTRGILDQNNGISEENLARFIAFASDVNLNWLFHDNGDPLNSSGSNLKEMQKGSYEQKIMLLQDECNEKGNRIISLLDENTALRKELEDIKKATE